MEPRDYFVIMCSEDGEVFVNQLSKFDLLKRIEEKYWGEVEFIDYIPDSDPQSWGHSVIIIKGNLVLPEPKTKVLKYDIK